MRHCSAQIIRRDRQCCPFRHSKPHTKDTKTIRHNTISKRTKFRLLETPLLNHLEQQGGKEGVQVQAQSSLHRISWIVFSNMLCTLGTKYNESIRQATIKPLKYKDHDLRVGGCCMYTILIYWGAKAALRMLVWSSTNGPTPRSM